MANYIRSKHSGFIKGGHNSLWKMYRVPSGAVAAMGNKSCTGSEPVRKKLLCDPYLQRRPPTRQRLNF